MSELKQTVHNLHEELAKAQQLGPEDRALLEAALADIRRVLESAPSTKAAEAEGDRLEGAAEDLSVYRGEVLIRLPLVARRARAFGVELEYMIVDARSLDVLPVTDRVLYAVAGEYLSEFELGSISWSNELALHLIELKTGRPAVRLESQPGPVVRSKGHERVRVQFQIAERVEDAPDAPVNLLDGLLIQHGVGVG